MKNQRVLYMVPLLLIAAYLAFFADKTPEEELVAPVARTTPIEPVGQGQPAASAPQAAAMPQFSQEPDASGVIPLAPRVQLAELAAAGGADLFAHGVGPSPEEQAAQQAQQQQEQQQAVQPPPQFPYAFIGKQFDGRDWQAFFEKGDTTLIVSSGAVVDNDFRVQSIKPPQMLVLHVPSKQIINIDIDNAQ
ncbi:hypothetical protein [Uliginosibacterium sp. H1]|uniref:hypothetical protein n=1 Tax=Uliginosibacterium sp. H1 TaxID=3114757 RepID=UPI002E174E15|nr:hypothetical protein [Uliginosibacterium sp. H1]